MRSARAPRRLIVVLVVVGLGLTACARPGRPTVDEWLPAWDHAVRSIPELDDLATGQTRDLCDEALVDLRIHRADLFPTPDESIDGTVDSWVETAEHTFFECPPTEGFEAAYGKLERFEAEIEVVLEIDQAA